MDNKKEQYPQYPPPSNDYGNETHLPPPQTAPLTANWLSDKIKNRPQMSSLCTVYFIFLSGGKNIAWSLGFGTQLLDITTHMRICWFIGAIIGAIVGAFLFNLVRKKLLMFFSSFAVLLGGILFVSLPQDYGAILAARYIDGLANGVIFPLAFIMAGEVSVKSVRGKLAASIDVTSLGMVFQIMFSSLWTIDSVHASQVHGGISIVYGLLALITAYLFVIESPVYLLVHGEEEKALDKLRLLQKPFIVTTETYEQLEDHKRYVAHYTDLTLKQSLKAGVPALVKLCFYRAMVAMSFSMILSYAILTTGTILHGDWIWPYVIYGVLRWLGTAVASGMMDSKGRKKPMLVGVLICAGMAIALGVIFDNLLRTWNLSNMSTAIYLLFVYQFFAGLSIAASSPYLSEAFPLPIKQYYIAIAYIVEMLLQIIICTVTLEFQIISNYMYSLGVLSIVFFLFGLACLPETKLTSLSVAQAKFRRWTWRENWR